MQIQNKGNNKEKNKENQERENNENKIIRGIITVYEKSTKKSNYRSTKITQHRKKKMNIQSKESNEEKTLVNQKGETCMKILKTQ